MTLEDAFQDMILWNCLEAMREQEDLQACTMESVTLGAGHSQAARSMLSPLFRILRPRRIIETGTSHGLTSAYMWALAKSLGSEPKVFTFDIFGSSLAPILWSRVGAADSIRFLRGDSATLIPTACTDGIDFALIDGDHTELGAKRDWQSIEPLFLSRSAAFFDNMDHVDGCGQFVAGLNPLWFHPGMAILVCGLDDMEMQTVFDSYVRSQLSSWLNAVPAKQGSILRHHLRDLLGLIQRPLPDCTRTRVADLCREISHLASTATRLRRSELREISVRYNIGSLAGVRRQRLIEALPEMFRPWVERIYHFLKQQAGGAARGSRGRSSSQ